MSKRLQDVEYHAQKFREDNGLSDKEPIRIKTIIQKNNILTVYKPLSVGFSGMSIKIQLDKREEDECKRFILVNCKHSVGKQHFTICHEFYHLFYQENFSAAVSCAGKFDKKGNPEEYNADMFGAYLLLPQWGIWELIPEDERGRNKISIATILSIEQYYSCSHSALLHRLLDMNLIDDAFKAKYLLGIKAYARKLGYDTRLYEEGNTNLVIGNYGTLAYKAWEEGIVSESSYLSLLEDLGVDISKISEEENGEE